MTLTIRGRLLVACLAVLSGVDAFICPRWCCNGYPKADKLRPYPQECSYPQDGWYDIVHNYPTGYCRSVLKPQVNTRLYLLRTFGDVYIGRGIGTIIHPPPIPGLAQGEAVFLGMYDRKSCILHGAIYDFKLTINDVAAWVFNHEDKSLSGHYVNCGYGANLMYRTRAWHQGHFSANQTGEMPEYLKTIKPHSDYEPPAPATRLHELSE